jgi:AAA+ ATPase superfamily predicted ATPase
VFHVARNRSESEELAELSSAAASVIELPRRRLRKTLFRDWDEAFDHFAAAAETEPLVVIIDELPELIHANPRVESALRAIWERMRDTKLRLLLCGSAVRTMEALQEERAPLFGRATLRMHVRPFAPHEAAQMLPDLVSMERARVWGVCGGMPLYLSLWDQQATFEDNLAMLVARPGGILLTEGELILATEDFAGGRRERIPEQVLRAIAAGRTRFGELKQALGTDPTRALAALQGLDLIERMQPVGSRVDPRGSYYRVQDNFLAFWLAVVEPHRSAIVRGHSRVATIIGRQFDHFMGDRWEEAFRTHLIHALADDERVQPMVDLGRFWKPRVATEEDPCEMDAVGLTGIERRLSLAGEAKWARSEDGRRVLRTLQRKVVTSGLLRDADPDPLYVICAREEVSGDLPAETLVVTAEDIFG